ncbi:MAG: DNA double-strand break repair nuclease NurA [Desulfovibrio sp.]|nr:DNA double-strand break repair nuclease NurA [Desulfovibrio sp.]
MSITPDIKEIIVIRSLTDSDLGIFAAHRNSATSKQRAVNINAPVAKLILSPELFASGNAKLDCLTTFSNVTIREKRHFGKVGKNWRLGGKKIEGAAFAELDSKDFMLLRTTFENDGTQPVFITFVGKKTDRIIHAGIVAIVGDNLDRSMMVYSAQDQGFVDLSQYCSPPSRHTAAAEPQQLTFPPMPVEAGKTLRKPRTMGEKLRQPHILERMLQVAGDLSAQAQHNFMRTVEELASILRTVLLETGGIIKIKKNHSKLWKSVTGKPIGFVDGGLANLSMLGSAPIAARVGGYSVIPGDYSPGREKFTILKYLIDELYASGEDGVYKETFPDISALRDAARISIEAAGAVKMLTECPELAWVLLHGSLVSPVSRYTDVIYEGKVRHRFPDFSDKALENLLPPEKSKRNGRDKNFVSTYLCQLKIMSQSDTIVCGVVEREGTTSTVCKSIIDHLDNHLIAPFLPEPPANWKQWFRSRIDPSEDDDIEGQRITDSLLFRCVLEPGEALYPVPVERNLLRKAPEAWKNVICNYPKPMVSYLQVTEWNAPIRIELFEKDIPRFADTAELIMHCSLLLPRYAFPVGLDIVDKYAKIPNWMSRPVNTHMAVRTLKQAMDSGDSKLFDSLRHLLCGSGREWLLRPGIYH